MDLNKTVKFSLQPILENDKVILYPLKESDSNPLYQVASDPKVWEQHPNKDRWKEDVFLTYFEGAIQSKGAFTIVDKLTGKIAGSTRFYDYKEQDNSIKIGYTFLGTTYWGKGFNLSVKSLMLEYLFRFVSRVYFEIGAENIRSQMAISRLNAKKVDEQEVAYFGELPKLNFIYEIEKEEWFKHNSSQVNKI